MNRSKYFNVDSDEEKSKSDDDSDGMCGWALVSLLLPLCCVCVVGNDNDEHTSYYDSFQRSSQPDTFHIQPLR